MASKSVLLLTLIVTIVCNITSFRALALDCTGQEPLYDTIYDQLAPFFGGISADHIEAGADYIRLDKYYKRPGEDDLGRPDVHANFSLPPSSPYFPWSTVLLVKLVFIGGKVYLPGGFIDASIFGSSFSSKAYIAVLQQLIDLSNEIDVPNLTLLVQADHNYVRRPSANGLIPPIFQTSTSHQAYDLILPDPYPSYNPYEFDDEWFALLDEHRKPWDSLKGTLIGRFGPSCPVTPIYSRRNHTNQGCSRPAFHKLSASDLNSEGLIDTGLYSAAETFNPNYTNVPKVDMLDMLDYKYVLNLDGISTAYRMPLLIAAHQVTLHNAGTPLKSFYTDAMVPWKHYVPVGADDFSDVFDIVRWLNANPDIAEQIAENGHEFAKRHLRQDGRFCYMAKLLENYAKLLHFDTGTLADYPLAVPLEIGLERLKEDARRLHGAVNKEKERRARQEGLEVERHRRQLDV